MNELTFSNASQLLRQNGFAPIPLGDNLQSVGPVHVVQTDWARYPAYADSPVGVLTSAPVARNAEAPIQNAKDTWLATLTVNAPRELFAEAKAIMAPYIGDAKCPVRIADDGLTFVFRLAGAQFSTIATDDPGFARVESAASFIALNGQWKAGISLLDVMRSELPPLSQEDARQLIGKLNALADAHAPPYIPPAPFVAPPILQPGARLTYGNRRGMDKLRENGFSPLPVLYGADDMERRGFSDANGRWHFQVDLTDHGVGIDLSRGFAVVELIGGMFREDVDAAIRGMGACLVRTVSGDQHPQNITYVFKSLQGGGDQNLYGASVSNARVRRTGLLVLSGQDMYERQFVWDGDLLTTKASSLAALERHDAARLERALAALPNIVEYKARKSA